MREVGIIVPSLVRGLNDITFAKCIHESLGHLIHVSHCHIWVVRANINSTVSGKYQASLICMLILDLA